MQSFYEEWEKKNSNNVAVNNIIRELGVGFMRLQPCTKFCFAKHSLMTCHKRQKWLTVAVILMNAWDPIMFYYNSFGGAGSRGWGQTAFPWFISESLSCHPLRLTEWMEGPVFECVGLIFGPLRGDVILATGGLPRDPACALSTELSALMLPDSSRLRPSSWRSWREVSAYGGGWQGRRAEVHRNPPTVAGRQSDDALSSAGLSTRLSLNTRRPGWCNISPRN